jgi:hypothetical protein
MNLLYARGGTTIPGYYTQAELLAALGMSRQNFNQSGLNEVIPAVLLGSEPKPGKRDNRRKLYAADVVGLWRYWLFCRRAWIALGVYPADQPLVPEGGRVPWWVETDEYGWECPVCGGTAISPPHPDDARLWCPRDGVQEIPPDDDD